MPYYQGDYYAGDPGIGQFFGKLVKSGIKLAHGLSGLQKGRRALPAVVAAPAAAGVATTGIEKVASTMIRHPVMTAAGGAAITGAGLAAAGSMAGRAVVGRMMGPAMGHMRGFHIEKRGKHAGQLIKNRRMNVCNVHALRRAVRRATGFARIAKKVLRFTSPRPPRGRAVFKHRRRAKRI